jgi:probable phosphoglycerate mutase
LRELNFGDQEGEHYDSLPEEEKKKISSLDYKPPNGETWPQARARAINYFKTLPEGHHLVSSHGGLICALAYHLGIKHVVPNCSMLSV